MYQRLRPLLFRLPAEAAHTLTLRALRLVMSGPVASRFASGAARDPLTLMGLDFPNRVGLAAGLDKNGDYIDALAALGFGFIEVGTVTPRPQPGNPKPRLFRLPEHQAVINRMGFNNKGVDHLVEQVRRSRFRGVVGVNIGKNKDTPADRAVEDYVECMRKAYGVASYIAVNVSSPNTPGLRDLQATGELDALLVELTALRGVLAAEQGRTVPLLLKVAPDLTVEEIEGIARAVCDRGVDGLIVGNTTLSRDGIAGHPRAAEAGGLSGLPLTHRSTEVLRAFARHLDGQVPLVGVGGIMSGEDASAKLEAGASLVQLYTGFIYRGPGLVREVSERLAADRANK